MYDPLKKIAPVKCESCWKKNLIIAGSIFLTLALFVFGAWSYNAFYNGRIFPGVYVGQHSLGGMTEPEVKDFIENFNNRMAKESLDLFYNKDDAPQQFKFNVLSADDSSVEMVRLASDSSAAKLMSAGRAGKFWQNIWQPLYYRFISRRQEAADVVIEERFVVGLENYLSTLSSRPHNAGIKIDNLVPLSYSVIPEDVGFIFDYDRLKADIQSRLSTMSLDKIEVIKKDFKPDVVVSELGPVTAKLAEVLNYGDLNLNYIDSQTQVRRDWSIGPDVYKEWLEIKREKGEPILALSKEKVTAYLETIRPYIDLSVQNTHYVMADGKIKEFRGSQSGVNLNAEKTYNDLDSLFRERSYNQAKVAKTVTVSVDVIKPTVEMSDPNDLGSMEVMGMGYSTFKDSHTNRIKNIANAVKRLDGILIKPGEEFSANKYAGPYTTENGFLPEMVIKGSKILPEVGGGMCQIGTTLFRMAMNTGMPISERRNHSLVVSYYADPVNGNPGTDATLYEPNVDFKFVNDTSGYLLLQTSVDYVKQQLVFTLWGKNDGRKGSYTHPVVSKWIPAGETQEIIAPVSPTLKAGQRTCQNAFRGAVASFTYTRFTSSSEKIERVFDSYYRPLPKICMTGSTSTPSISVE